MKKKHLNLSVDKDLVTKARAHGIVISKFLENKLQEYFNFIDAISVSSNVTLRGRFELPLPRWRTGSQGRRVRPNFATSACLKIRQ
jgi:hypothetical protein